MRSLRRAGVGRTPRHRCPGEGRLVFLVVLGLTVLVPAGKGQGEAPVALPEVRSAAAADLAWGYATRIESDLRNNILPFWLTQARDVERDGFFNEISNDLVIERQAPRGGLLTARILWTFAAAYRVYGEPQYLAMACWARRDLAAHFVDPTNGGVYWSIDADGSRRDDRKVIYGQAFAIYALSEYFRATQEPQALEEALAIYRLVERHAHDRTSLGYHEEFTREWRPTSAKSAMGAQGAKSQNAHLHLLEAYTNLLRVWPDETLRANLRELIEVLLARVLDRDTHHLRLFMDRDWTPRSETISYGHDIEFSWLLVEAAEVLGDPALLARARAEAVAIARATAAEGLDRDGGLYNEGEAGAGVTDARKEWWPQAEAAVGFLGAYQLSGDPTYLRHALGSWDFIERRLIDRERGEWRRGVTREGVPLERFNKVSFWKCPYHNSRAAFELIHRLRALGAAEP